MIFLDLWSRQHRVGVVIAVPVPLEIGDTAGSGNVVLLLHLLQ